MKMNIDLSLLPPGSRVLCAVSGGADSMCLLDLLWGRREELGIEVCCAHYEHGLRGEEALRDAEFVERWCEERAIPFVLEHGDVAAYGKEHGLGVEEAARLLRYDFLERAADKLRCDRIATAHNADDFAETMLLNLVRGSGGAGLRGIPRARGRIVRPLLGVPRREIEEYLKERAVPHVEDSSNDSEQYSRNLLRRRVMPVLRQVNPQAAAAMGRTAKLLERDEQLLGQLAADFLREHSDGESLPLEPLRALHPAIASRVIRALCPQSLSFEQAERALAFIEGTERKLLQLPGITLRRERGRLYFAEERRRPLPDRIVVPGQTLELPEARLHVESTLIDCTQEVYDLFKTLFLKCENICGTEIVCTAPRPGDRMHPANRGCGKSLKALFAEAGYSLARRERTPVFRDEQGILAVYGLAVDQRAAAKPGERALRLTFQETAEDRGNGKRH